MITHSFFRLGRVQRRGRLLRRRDGIRFGRRRRDRSTHYLWRLRKVDDSLRGVAKEQSRYAAVPAVLGHGKQCRFQHFDLGVDRHDRRFECRGSFPQDLCGNQPVMCHHAITVL